ncbi:cyclic nucleotide-gated cation channel subunit A-like [Pararge aegeria]|nr:cyclic nucleotide-gated cation channel subunit A-like [Pararge aegeria]
MQVKFPEAARRKTKFKDVGNFSMKLLRRSVTMFKECAIENAFLKCHCAFADAKTKRVERNDKAKEGGCWVGRQYSRLKRNLVSRFSRGGRSATPDQFMTKFTPESVDDPQEPMYRWSSATVCCGVRLAFDTSLRRHYYWLAVVSMAVLYNVLFVVVRAVFWELNDLTWAWYVCDYICDFVYLVDIVVHMHEGYLEQGLMVRDSAMLRQHYIRSGLMIIEILSVIPTDILYYWWRPGSCGHDCLPCPVILRLNRLLHIPRMWEWFDRTEAATSYPNAFRIWKVVMAILVLIHWNACLYFVISYAIGFGVDNWVYNITGGENATLAHQYIYSFYWSTLTLTTIGETPQPENNTEFVFVVIDFLGGVLIFATIVGNIGSMISNMNVARVEFQNKMDGVKQYMAFRKVSGELEARVIRWFAYTWNESGALDEENVLSSLPDKLKAEIAIRVHLDTLREVEIFKDCEPGLLEALVLKLRLQVFSPGDSICCKGDVGKEMYIVKRGRLQVVADDKKTVLATLSAGSVFGEVSVLEIPGNTTGNRRTANVRSLGYSDLFCLAKKDLWEALGDYPDAMHTLIQRGCQLLRKDGLLDETVFKNAQTNENTVQQSIKQLQVSYEIIRSRYERFVAEVGAKQAEICERINHLFLRCTTPTDEDSDQDYVTTYDDFANQTEFSLTYPIDSFEIVRGVSPVGFPLQTFNIPLRDRGQSSRSSAQSAPGLVRANTVPRCKYHGCSRPRY